MNQTCIKCGITKDVSEYYRRSATVIRKECKRCAIAAVNKRNEIKNNKKMIINDICNELTDEQIKYLMSDTINEEMEKSINIIINHRMANISAHYEM